MARAKEFDRDEALAKAPAVDVVKSDTASPAVRWRRHALRRRFRYFKSTPSAPVQSQRRSSEELNPPTSATKAKRSAFNTLLTWEFRTT